MMQTAQKADKLDASARVAIPVFHLPMFRTSFAVENGVEKNILIKTWGGLGDQICAEPTLRFAIKTFKDCKISLASEAPELFSHLSFHRVFDLRQELPNYSKFLTFDTITSPDDSNLVWQFISHMITNCVDFPSMCAFRCQLPIADKEIQLSDKAPEGMIPFLSTYEKNRIYVHAGRHWQSKTFPKSWWDSVLAHIIKGGAVPVLIGGDHDKNRGTVDVDTKGCIDLRNKTSIAETVWLLKRAKVLLTNDSAPLHMAAAGDAWIGFIATCKHPDMIMHWRHGQWAWREKNLGLGGIWDVLDYCPNKDSDVTAENVGDHLETWLPSPESFAEWGIEKLNENRG